MIIEWTCEWVLNKKNCNRVSQWLQIKITFISFEIYLNNGEAEQRSFIQFVSFFLSIFPLISFNNKSHAIYRNKSSFIIEQQTACVYARCNLMFFQWCIICVSGICVCIANNVRELKKKQQEIKPVVKSEIINCTICLR